MGSFVIRHWRGQISLIKSFWGVFVLGHVLIQAVINILSKIYAPAAIPGSILWPLVGFYIPVFIWQAVGTWRSLRNCARGKPGAAEILSRYERLAPFGAVMMLVIGALATASLAIPNGNVTAAAIGLVMTGLCSVVAFGVVRLIGMLAVAFASD
jgi:hypothetical protein